MNLIELIIDDKEDLQGVEAISVVASPAIESDFVALKSEEVRLAEINKEKRILMGAVLIPEKPIYRRNGEDEYYIYFSKDTVVKASQLFLKNGNQGNSTLEHSKVIEGLTVVESWIVEDLTKDKSALYNLNVPLGTWMASVKVDNDEIWNDYVKTGKVKGFSLEGHFADQLEKKKELSKVLTEEEELIEKIKEIILKTELESYTDYPDAVSNNAKRGIELNEKNGNKCATQVGKVRAQQLANKEPISEETIKRMYSYLSRAKEYYNENDTEACGTISYLLWGGDSALSWSERKLEQITKA
jgi:hypothetical protein